MKNYKIYLITNLVNNKKYVGITKFSIEKRFIEHTKRGFILTESIKKYGKENFSIIELDECFDEQTAFILEKKYISDYNTKVPNGYNLTDGGDGIIGWTITEEQRILRSKQVKELHKDKKVGMHGKKHSDETKLKISESHRGRPKEWLRGRTLSDETKQKIREKHLGKIVSEETRKRISKNHHDVSGKNNPMYGKKHSPETIEKIKKQRYNLPKRMWINNGIEEKLIQVDESIPNGYNKGRVKK